MASVHVCENVKHSIRSFVERSVRSTGRAMRGHAGAQRAGMRLAILGFLQVKLYQPCGNSLAQRIPTMNP